MSSETDQVARLFAEAVPEIAAGIVEIRSIARDPGHRCKVAVISRDPEVDCIGVCVGVGGCRIKQVVDALDGDRIDLVRCHSSPEEYIASALQPAEIERVILFPTEFRAVVVVRPDQMSLALGRRGGNCRLAAELTGWSIDVQELPE